MVLCGYTGGGVGLSEGGQLVGSLDGKNRESGITQTIPDC